MKKLTKRQIKRIALIHSATLIDAADACMFDDDCNITIDEAEMIVSEILKLAEKISKKEPLNLGCTSAIIKYVREN